MLATTTTNIEHVQIEGPVSVSFAVVIGVLLLAVSGWSLWRERRILGRNQTILFWSLRGITLGVAIWMLLAPSRVSVQTSTTRRSVAIVTDISASMRTIDPAGGADDVRWAVTLAEGDEFLATESADRAIAAIGLAQRHLAAASTAIRQHAPEGDVVEATMVASRALDRMKQHLVSVSESSTPAGRTRTLAERLVLAVDGAEFEAFARLSNALQKGRNPSEKGWRESLPDLEDRLASLSRSLHELARHAAEEDTSRVAGTSPELLASARKQSRLGHAAGLVGRLDNTVLAGLREKADVRLGAFEQSVNLLPSGGRPEATLRAFGVGDDDTSRTVVGTDLAAVLEQINRDRQEHPVSAVFLLTDVAHNEAETDPREAAATLIDVPVYVIPIGNTRHVRDVKLQSVYAPNVAMRNDDVVIEARVQAYDCEGEVCTVQLLQDGDVVDFREVLLDSGFASRSVRFEQQMPTVGHQRFQIVIVPLDRELSEDNNYGEVEVNVTRSDIKLLLSDELPRWEYRYLAQLFRRDPKIECDELLFHPRMIATGRREETQTFPVTVEEWDQYDVVLLGDVPTDHLPVAAQESLIEYLKVRGGTLVMIAGRESMPHQYVNHPLLDIVPVQPVDSSVQNSDQYAFRVTEDGQDHLALMIGETEEATRTAWDFVNRFSPLHAVSDWRQPRPSARTLISAIPRDSVDEEAAAKANAFLCWQPVGRGRIVYLSSPDTYRLRFLRGDRLHYRFWGQLLRWAVATDLTTGSKFVRVRTDRSRYDSRDDIQVVVRLTDSEGQPLVAAGLEVRLTSGDDERVVPLSANSDVPGEYVGSVTSLPPGVYRVEPTGEVVDSLQKDSEQVAASATFTVQADLPMELVDTRSDRALAQQIADITGGQVLPPTAVDEIFELTNLEPIVTEVSIPAPLWIQWKFLWIIFGCLQTEWAIRKWKGLS